MESCAQGSEEVPDELNNARKHRATSSGLIQVVKMSSFRSCVTVDSGSCRVDFLVLICTRALGNQFGFSLLRPTTKV